MGYREQKEFLSAYQFTVTNEAVYPWRDKKNWTSEERTRPSEYEILKIGLTKEIAEMYDLPSEWIGWDAGVVGDDDDEDDPLSDVRDGMEEFVPRPPQHSRVRARSVVSDLGLPLHAFPLQVA